jgi:hypothetical protein
VEEYAKMWLLFFCWAIFGFSGVSVSAKNEKERALRTMGMGVVFSRRQSSGGAGHRGDFTISLWT